MLKGKHIILGVTGGIAAYKTALLTRLLVKAGAEVQPLMTPAAKEFITPLTLSTLSGRPVISEFFTANTGEWHSHVSLSLWADAMVVAPATACTMAKMATGVADNMLVTTYLSARAPVFVAPAMDLDMMAHPSTLRNLRTLRDDGCHIIEPAEGELASHLTGRGRMAEPEEILRTLVDFFTPKTLAGKTILITGGPTREPIDPVRFISNHSSGRMASALADEAARRGAAVELVAGPLAVYPSCPDVKVTRVETAREMLAACEILFSCADIAILAAAVADYAVTNPAAEKIKREGHEVPQILLTPNPDIAATLGSHKRPGQLLVGFALETAPAEGQALENARRKLAAKHLDMIVLNSLSDPGAGFSTSTNKITIITANNPERPLSFPLKSKTEVADDILDTLSTLPCAAS